jgi:hypothetical protein
VKAIVVEEAHVRLKLSIELHGAVPGQFMVMAKFLALQASSAARQLGCSAVEVISWVRPCGSSGDRCQGQRSKPFSVPVVENDMGNYQPLIAW